MHLYITPSVQSSCLEFGVETDPEEDTECELAARHDRVAEPPKPRHKIHRAKVLPGTHACYPSPGRLSPDSSYLTYHLQTFLQDEPSPQVHVTV